MSGWIRCSLAAYHEQAQAVRNRITRAGRAWQALAGLAAATGRDDRVVSAMHDVAMTGRVRRLRHEHAEGLSLQQAQRDLRDLAAAQVLEPVGRTRARYYTEGARFPAGAIAAARTPMPVVSPYSIGR